MSYFFKVLITTIMGAFLILILLSQPSKNLNLKQVTHPVITNDKLWNIGKSNNFFEDKSLKTPKDYQSFTHIKIDKQEKINQLKSLITNKKNNELFALEINEYKPKLLKNLVDLIKNNNINNQVVVTSFHDGVLKDLRINFPQLITNIGQANVTRSYLLAGLGLSSLIKLKGEIFIAEAKKLSDNSIKVLVKEVHKQKKSFLLRGHLTDEQKMNYLPMGVDGFFNESEK